MVDDLLERLRAAIASIDDRDVVALVTQARGDAAERVREILTDLFTEALLRRAADAIAVEVRDDPTDADARRAEPAVDSAAERAVPRAPVDAPVVAATPDPDPGDVWYVYGLQPADAAAPSGLGVGAREVTAVSAGPVRALVSQVPAADFGQDAIGARVEDLAWLSAQAAAHEDVLVRALGDGPVLPLRFGTIYRSDDAIAAFLDAHGAAFADELARLRGCAEWAAKLIVDRDAWDAAAAAEVGGEPDEASSEGHAFFARKRQEHARREAGSAAASEAAAEVHRRLADTAVEARTGPPQRPEVSGQEGDTALNGAYLVADGQRDAFAAVADELRDRYGPRGARLEVSGPWPAHSFVRLPPLDAPPAAGVAT